MGDIADYYLEQAENSDLYFEDVMYIEETDSYIGHGRNTTPLHCKFCNRGPLKWQSVGSKWIMHEMNGDPHNCPNHPLPLNVLKDLVKQKTKLPMADNVNKTAPQQLLPIPSWDEFFMRHVYLAASKSRDPRTKIGAVLVKDGVIISEGFNGFPRKVKDLPERYLNRNLKHKFVVHAEANSILNAATHGTSTKGTILYTNGIPCDSCGKTIIQAGIAEVVIHEQWPEILSEFWKESTELTKIMFEEANIPIRKFRGNLALQGLVDGKVINV
jgi:dCMP deaminase